jgi:hypothetical protein
LSAGEIVYSPAKSLLGQADLLLSQANILLTGPVFGSPSGFFARQPKIVPERGERIGSHLDIRFRRKTTCF